MISRRWTNVRFRTIWWNHIPGRVIVLPALRISHDQIVDGINRHARFVRAVVNRRRLPLGRRLPASPRIYFDVLDD